MEEEKKNVFEILNEALRKRNQTLSEIMAVPYENCHFLHSLQTDYSFDFTDTSVNFFLFAKDRNVVGWLVNAGADINEGWETDGAALTYAVWDRDEDLVYTFLDMGAKPTKKFLESLGKLYTPSFLSSILPFLEKKDVLYLFSIRKRFPENMQEFLSSLGLN